MSISLLYGCFQIETCVRDLDAARGFVEDVLRGGRIERQLAQEIGELFPDGGYRVDHLDCGQATFQMNEPSPSLEYRGNKSVHQQYLERFGPCVTNLNYYVDDIVHAREILSTMGAAVLIEGPSSVAASLGDYGPENTRPGADGRPFLFMGSRPWIGLDLEIMEPNFVRFVDQTVQYPCFSQPRPETGDGNLKLERLRIVVADVTAAYDSLLELFAPGSRSKPYAVRTGAHGYAFRIGLGGIELEYCSPLTSATPLGEFLNRQGPGVVTAEFSVGDEGVVLKRARDAGYSVAEAVDLLGERERGVRRWHIGARDLVGFDVVLEPRGVSVIEGSGNASATMQDSSMRRGEQ